MIEQLKKLNIGEVLENVDLKKYNTYRISGNAACIVFPNNLFNLIELLEFLKNNNIKYKVIGKGSNLIFNDGYDGVLIKLDKFDKFIIQGNEITIGAGCSLIKVSNQLARLGYTGFEFATGIPGSVGGAIFMNAGAYKSDMGYIVKSVTVLTPDLKVKELTNYDLDFHYRTSFIQKNPGYICLEATIILKKGNSEEILQLIDDRKKRRLETIAPPICLPFNPDSSINLPAKSPSGFLNTEPADGYSSGCDSNVLFFLSSSNFNISS